MREEESARVGAVGRHFNGSLLKKILACVLFGGFERKIKRRQEHRDRRASIRKCSQIADTHSHTQHVNPWPYFSSLFEVASQGRL